MSYASKRAVWAAEQLAIATQYLSGEEHHELVAIRGEIEGLIERLGIWADGAEVAEGLI